MIEDVERKRLLVRWWIGMATSSLVLAFGAFRVGMQLLRRKYLFDEDEENREKE